MAKKRVLAVVNVKAKKGELVYYKDGKLIAVEAKRGGTKGAKRKCSTAKPAAKKKTAAKKKAAPKRKAAPKKKAVARKGYRKGQTVRVKLTNKTDGVTGYATGKIVTPSSGSSQLVEYKNMGSTVRKYKSNSEISAARKAAPKKKAAPKRKVTAKRKAAPKKKAATKRRQLSLF